ncbi:MAG: hypothetical protein KF902_00830 [Phycisphaeraceae bacterium]|nr:hypothetical protein [Phycisphaeraceae bacterium]
MRRPKPQNDAYAALGPIRSWIWGLMFIFGFGLAVWVNIWLFNGPLPERSPIGQVIGRLALLMFLVMIGDTALGFILRIGFNHPWRLVGPLMCRYLDFMSSLGKQPSKDSPPNRQSETRDP